MNMKLATGVAAVLLVMGVAACSPAAQKADTDSSTAVGPIRSVGVVKSIDATTGSITLDHEAIPAIHWGPMMMEFKAQDPAMLEGVAVGDHVAFELKSADDPQTVVAVQKQ